MPRSSSHVSILCRDLVDFGCNSGRTSGHIYSTVGRHCHLDSLASRYVDIKVSSHSGGREEGQEEIEAVVVDLGRSRSRTLERLYFS